MKIFALFLGIVAVMLSITPCCAQYASESRAHEIAQQKKHECTQQNDDCSKDCSPFYVCGTCIGFTLTQTHAIIFTPPIQPVTHNTAYISVALAPIQLSIWQPPKFS